MHTLVINLSYLLSVMAVRLEMDNVQVKRAIQSAGERMGHAKVKDEQFPVIEDVVRAAPFSVQYQGSNYQYA